MSDNQPDPFQYVRDYYGVPAYKGGRVRYEGGDAPREGVITRAGGAHFYIQFDDCDFESGPFHPTWKLDYLDPTLKSQDDGASVGSGASHALAPQQEGPTSD